MCSEVSSDNLMGIDILSWNLQRLWSKQSQNYYHALEYCLLRGNSVSIKINS